jgi:hypothetical protein
MMIDNTFVVYGGFENKGAWVATKLAYTLDTSNTSAKWERTDDINLPLGLTHGAHVRLGSKIINCGGYLGKHPGDHTAACIVYDHSKPLGQKWSTLASLPDGRGGGGMFYNTQYNAIYYVSGAQRYVTRYENGTDVLQDTVDFNTTWMYSFNNPGNGWVTKASLPYASNHMMAVTTKDGNGKERHYAFGGQKKEDECNGNYALLYEYDAIANVWIRRQDMLIPRAHGSESTIPIGCGFLLVAGNSNGCAIISDVTYYNVATDTWTNIGKLPSSLNTPVCDINRNTDDMYCETGKIGAKNSYYRQIIF